ncbi:cupin domain-containing protein [Paenibacillus sp. JX-17]|uniref:Cupin domain-containing protein n=1 Tax=Paenibacillus lacisoli TaxID=3064525 RepID=A0ABT9CF87_9BACL|nr:cupin domain-containing protein [Paenibacillus sp. JX-17]MDO7906356.1 cupin domain-containing protein [Paenibacillus sp. JX-17]
MQNTEIQTYLLQPSGVLPNHPVLPVLVYIRAFESSTDTIEAVFNRHRWLNSWKNGIFPYAHYHSNAHEVLGIASGEARLQIGGADGITLDVHAGDVLVLPAGTAHQCLRASEDFSVIGAYPDGMDYNIHKEEDGAIPGIQQEIAAVPLPATDPVFGEKGPLLNHWTSPAS